MDLDNEPDPPGTDQPEPGDGSHILPLDTWAAVEDARAQIEAEKNPTWQDEQ